ncbi:hypothetical protein VIBNISO65_130023 [Vibrio nigripulchritudo SO65]|nr:hypothetical protein VIBNIAM115_700005 [Vibrio nigripulchritudo AM115]CCN41173.1 hypothetical protein VIBNIFTn2_1490005 [Vibrio nigripulchritudo FTn2]CCN66982.1 hypothetical protein VIBNIPon4_670005 [Vibrio nigripulchritudo POn4]CCN75210.1 hypothetical protein VIBNISO65_130023 [Vibrio nigripulchritudo SO65]
MIDTVWMILSESNAHYAVIDGTISFFSGDYLVAVRGILEKIIFYALFRRGKYKVSKVVIHSYIAERDLYH